MSVKLHLNCTMQCVRGGLKLLIGIEPSRVLEVLTEALHPDGERGFYLKRFLSRRNGRSTK